MADQVHRLRPHSSLFRQGLVATVVFMTPVFIALYVLTIPGGAWRLVLAIHILVTVVVVVAAALFFLTGIRVDAKGIRERGYFGRVTYVPVSEIGSIILADTFSGSVTEPIPQLFVCDEDGNQLVRMRGTFWSKQSMDVVVATLDVPHMTLDDAMSHKELHTEYPGLLYWFERRPVIAALAFTAATAVVGGLVLLVLNLLGIAA